jgi:hypothetical protein
MTGRPHTEENTVLEPDQKLAVLEYAKLHSKQLWGKINQGVKKIEQLRARKAFVEFCKSKEIPYKDFDKFDSQFKNWKSLATKQNTLRKNKSGWELMPHED